MSDRGELSITLQDARGRRRATAADLPLALGGPDAGLEITTAEGAPPLAWIGLSEGELFVQPAGPEALVACNGSRLTSSHWLRPGDELRLGESRVSIEQDGGGICFRVQALERTATPPKLVPPAPLPIRDAAGLPIEPIDFRPKAQQTGRRRGLTPSSTLRIVAVVALLALAAAAAFVFTARSVEVEITPAADELAFEGGLALELGGRFLMRPGKYTLSARKDGYLPLSRTVEVTREARQTLRFELEKLAGLLEISTPGVTGADISIDSQVVGKTPLPAPLEVAAGERLLRVSAARHQDFVERLTVAGAGELQTVVARLEPNWAPVSFASEPAGATVTIDGRPVGVTPLTAEIGAGRHDFEIGLGGHKPFRGQLEVVADRPLSVPAARLTRLDGSLRVITEPAGAAVTIDGEFRGAAPLELTLAPRAGYEIKASKAGHRSEARTVEVRSGEAKELSIALAELRGEVKISTWPPDAELKIDGEVRGAPNQTLELPARPHAIEVSKPGYETFRATVTPAPGLPQAVEARLRSVEELQAAATPPRIRTSEGQELLLVAPGSFNMGAPRREPGRRSNEVSREIQLTRAFYLGTQEVSNRQFRRFNRDHLSGQVSGQSLEIDHHPAVRVSWHEAAEYCNWLSRKEGLEPVYARRDGRWVASPPVGNGYRLPTEAEWAWAARFSPSGVARKYPWGDALPVAPGSGNFADAAAGSILAEVLSGFNDGFPATAPVEAFGPDDRGFFNLGGNAAEWVNDFYALQPSRGVEKDPLGPEAGEHRVIRGSSWRNGTISELRLTYRDYGTEARPDVGFRIARYAE